MPTSPTWEDTVEVPTWDSTQETQPRWEDTTDLSSELSKPSPARFDLSISITGQPDIPGTTPSVSAHVPETFMETVNEQLGVVGDVAKAIPADVAWTLSRNFQNIFKDDKGAGNFMAALKGEPLPIDEVISDSAQYSKERGEFPTEAAIGQLSQDLAATAPLIL